MKKALAIIISLCFIFSLTACETVENLLGNESSGQIIYENQPIEKIECDTLDVTIDTESDHNALDITEYYRFTTLTEEEQKVYLAIEKAVNVADICVDLTDISINYERALEVAQIFMADCPQYFYLSKYVNAIHYENSDDAVELRLYYTDGKVTDTVDGEKLTAEADRDLIEEQIETFNQTVKEILNAIPTTASDDRKVKAIHDIIVANTEYDEESADLIDTEDMTPAYTAYGALCEGMAVCEGYAKSFQLLCYNLGINAAQVYGTGDGEPHMWNLVEINGSWYHTDLTWDDPVGGSGFYYDYYNLSWNEMKKDHAIDDELLVLP